MIIPETVVINGKTWKIRLISCFGGERGKMGECSFDTRTIKLQKGMHPKELLITLIHEILHAIYPLDVTGAETEETIVEAMDAKLVKALGSLGVLHTSYALPYIGPSEKHLDGLEESPYLHGLLLTKKEK